MDKLAIIGGRELYGELDISGAKNSALKVMVASLLTDGPLVLTNVPNLADVRQLTVLLDNHGVDVEREGDRMTLHAKAISSTVAPEVLSVIHLRMFSTYEVPRPSREQNLLAASIGLSPLLNGRRCF